MTGTVQEVGWTSGGNLVVVDVVSPFNPAEVIAKRFLDGVRGSMGEGEEK